MRVDMYPQWLDDSTMVFARHVWQKNDNMVPSLVAMYVDDTEATPWADFTLPDDRYVVKQMVLLQDGRLVCAADTPDGQVDLFNVAAGERPQQVDTGELAFFHLADANETHVLLFDPSQAIAWRIPMDGSGAPESVNEIFELEANEPLAWPPAFGPTQGSMVIARANRNRTVSVYENERVKELAYLRGPESSINHLRWVPGRVLVSGRDASWVIPHES